MTSSALERIEVDLTGDCTGACVSWLKPWYAFWERWSAEPVALLTCAGYYEGLRPKSRSMVRQAERRYTFREFVHNDHRAEIEAINFSKSETSEGPMRGWYTEPVRPLGPQGTCPKHRDAWHGGFDADGVLRGYSRLIVLNEIAVIHDIFSHAEGSTGVLNGLLAHMTRTGLAHISYHVMDAGSPGRQAFKERTGFRAVTLCTR